MLALYLHVVGTVCRDVHRTVEGKILKVSVCIVSYSARSCSFYIFIVMFSADASSYGTVSVLGGCEGSSAAHTWTRGPLT